MPKVKLTVWVSPECAFVVRECARQAEAPLGDVVETALHAFKNKSLLREVGLLIEKQPRPC